MRRRDFLKMAGLIPFAAMAPRWAHGSERPLRTLVLVQLQGGNDGLNTVVPFKQKRYGELRPNLALPTKSLLTLGGEEALHPAFKPLLPAWEAGEMAVVRGVGYPEPNRSHFRSTDIWETATTDERKRYDGWLERAAGDFLVSSGQPGGIVLGNGEVGPLRGADPVAMNSRLDLSKWAKEREPVSYSGDNGALAHIVATQNKLLAAADTIESHLQGAKPLGVAFPTSGIGRQLEATAEMLAAGLPIAVVKLTHGGFDTHVNQIRRHDTLLERLTEALASFRQAMMRAGLWSNALVMTYSEFGRRAAENANRGTDHGTAAPQFVLGGKVNGGWHGTQPSLADLDGEDLKYHVDFRQLYGTILKRWWELPGADFGDFATLDFV